MDIASIVIASLIVLSILTYVGVNLATIMYHKKNLRMLEQRVEESEKRMQEITKNIHEKRKEVMQGFSNLQSILQESDSNLTNALNNIRKVPPSPKK